MVTYETNFDLKKNIIANYIGKIWNFGSVYIFIRFYVDFLGVESYGIINFYNVLFALIFFLDVGLAATLNREFARTDDKVYLRNLISTVEKIFLVVIFCIVILVFLLSELIATKWLSVEELPIEIVSNSIRIMGFSIAIQLYTSLYNSGLVGLEKQVLQNSIQTVGSVFRSAVVLVPLYFYPNLYTFFIWQLLINIAVLLIMRSYLWKSIPFGEPPEFNLGVFKNLKKFALGMLVMSIIGSLNTQMDKLITSKLLSLTEYAYYSLCSVLSQAPTLIVVPILIALLPRLTRYVESKNIFEVKKAFHTYSYVISTLTFSLGTILFLFSKYILQYWLNQSQVDGQLIIASKYLLFGSFFLALQFMPYYLALANGHTKTNVRLGLISLVLNIPLTIFFTKEYGLIGPGISWIIVNFLAFITLGYIITKRFLRKGFYKWLSYDILVPFLICLSIGFIGYLCLGYIDNLFKVILISAILGFLSLGINFLIFNLIKKTLYDE